MIDNTVHFKIIINENTQYICCEIELIRKQH